MKAILEINLHKLARFTNAALPVLTLVFLFLGTNISFYFHFLTVPFLFTTIINLFYLRVQTAHTILRNFGIIGQGRYMIESLGPELRQYLFMSDREGRPFSRVERVEIYRKAKNVEAATSFGSLEDFDAHEVKIRHSLYPVSREELEPFRVTFGEERELPAAYSIDKPIMISAMSYGALGSHAVRALARGARMAGIPMNTGEGGFPKYPLMEGCDLIFQMGTAKFGVRNHDGSLNEDKLRDLAGREAVRMVEIKFSQGAKPGKGGLLPKEKITSEIAGLRGIPEGKDAVSPPGHVECGDHPSTVAFIRRIQEITGLPVGIKMCIGCFGEFRALVQEMKHQDSFPDYISIDGSEGGTGAAPKAFLDVVGVPLLPALRGVNDILTEEGVRHRLKLISAGKLINPGKWILAMCLGADACYTARGFMLSIGCIQALQCAENTCPVGITTHDPALQRGLVIPAKAKRVQNYVENCMKEFEDLLCSAGCRSARQLDYQRLYTPSGSSLFIHDTGQAPHANPRKYHPL